MKWQPNPVFLLEKIDGQRSLVDNSPWGHKESDMTEHTQKQHPSADVKQTVEYTALVVMGEFGARYIH